MDGKIVKKELSLLYGGQFSHKSFNRANSVINFSTVLIYNPKSFDELSIYSFMLILAGYRWRDDLVSAGRPLWRGRVDVDNFLNFKKKILNFFLFFCRANGLLTPKQGPMTPIRPYARAVAPTLWLAMDWVRAQAVKSFFFLMSS